MYELVKVLKISWNSFTRELSWSILRFLCRRSHEISRRKRHGMLCAPVCVPAPHSLRNCMKRGSIPTEASLLGRTKDSEAINPRGLRECHVESLGLGHGLCHCGSEVPIELIICEELLHQHGSRFSLSSSPSILPPLPRVRFVPPGTSCRWHLLPHSARNGPRPSAPIR